MHFGEYMAKKDKQFCLRMSSNLYKRIERRAKKHNRSVNDYILSYISYYNDCELLKEIIQINANCMDSKDFERIEGLLIAIDEFFHDENGKYKEDYS